MVTSPAYDSFAEEIDRVVGCPYPTQLRTLEELVSQCSDADTSQWAAAKPCLVDPLVSRLVEGLQDWSYVLDIIAKLALNTSLRDAFLQQEPTLLHSVVAKAIKPGDLRSRYAAAGVALLSRRLPQTVALPAEVQTLFVQLVEEAARKPSSTTIEPVYRLLTGTGDLLLGLLNPEVAIKFEEHLLNILKNGSGPNDQGLGLYCLSIFNVVCCSMSPEFRLTASSYNSSDFLASTPTSSKWKAEAMQQFFTGSKAQRSLQLLAIVVIWATNRNTPDSEGDKIRCLVLVNEVITAIPLDLRKNWCTVNTVMVRKLQEKLCAEHLDDTIKTLALRFMGKLCDLDSLPHPVLESIEMTFLEPQSVQTAHTFCPHVVDNELFANVLARAPISLLLKNAVEYAIRADSTELASGLAAVTFMLRDALNIIEDQKITGHEIRAALNEPSFAQALQHLKDLVEQAPNQDPAVQSSGWCKRALLRMRSNLAHQISNLLLRVCHSSSISHSSMNLLLSLHASSARGDQQCNHERRTWSDDRDLMDPIDQDAPDDMDWRESLQTHFKARAQVEQDAVSRLFAKACANLEARCENVEKPLREERNRRSAAEKHNEELTQALAQFEAQNMDHVLKNRELEEEKEHYLQSLEGSRDENEELIERVKDLEQKLKEAQTQGEMQLSEMRTAKEISDLDAAASIAKKQEELEELQEELSRACSGTSAKEEQIVTLKDELNDAHTRCQRLEQDLAKGNGHMAEVSRSVEEFTQRTAALESANEQLQMQLELAKGQMREQAEDIVTLRHELQSAQAGRDESKLALEQSSEHLRALRSEHEQLQQFAKEQESVATSTEEQLANLREEIRSNSDHYTATITAQDAKIKDLKDKTERLRRKCQQKDQQIAEAESMRANLIAAMGLNQQQVTHRSRDSILFSQEAEDEDDPTPPTPSSGNHDMAPDSQHTQQPLASSLESLRNGPTPKRSCPRRSVPAPATAAKTRASMGVVGGKGSQWAASRRRTLGVVSANANRLATSKTPVKDKQVDFENDETTFDESALFAGTQGRE